MRIKQKETDLRNAELLRLKKDKRMRNSQLIGSGAGFLLSILLFWIGNGAAIYVLTTIGIIGAVISLILFLIFFRRWYLVKQEVDQVQAGVDGETSVLQALSVLPDSYIAVPDPKITYRKGDTGMSVALLGPNGIFLIDAFNLRGELSGNDGDRHLILTHPSKAGSAIETEIPNPVKQASSHTNKLTWAVRDIEEELWVQGMLYFANPELTLDLDKTTGNLPIFAASDGGNKDLPGYIRAYEGPIRRPLTGETVERIAAAL